MSVLTRLPQISSATIEETAEKGTNPPGSPQADKIDAVEDRRKFRYRNNRFVALLRNQ